MNQYNNIIFDISENIIAPGSRCTISSVIDESIKDVLINKYGDNWKENEQIFLDGYERLRTNFNVDTYRDDIPYFYSIYYLPLNIPKIQLILLQMLKRKKFDKKIKILDIGSGVGTTAFAIIDLIAIFDNIANLFNCENIFDEVTMDFIEGSPHNINTFNENVSFFTYRMKEYVNLEKIKINSPQQMDITKDWIKDEKYDIIIFSNMLNEFDYKNRVEIAIKSTKNLNENGSLIILEPANRKKAEDLNKLKWDIVGKTKLNCLLPCGSSKKCAKCWIFRKTDLVHNDLIKYIDNLYEKKYGKSKYKDFHNNRLKWSYIILSKTKLKTEIISLEELPVDDRVNASFYIVGQRSKNLYKICDGHGNNDYFLTFGKGINKKLDYGDFIETNNVIKFIDDDKKYLIIDKETRVINRYGRNQNKKINFKNASENTVKFILKRLWGFDDLREGQYPIIKNALLDVDTLGILPTGAGKSLCYQLPAMLKLGASIVVSPLKSLIKDQVDNLKKMGFEFVDFIDSSKNTEEKIEVLNRFKDGYIKILYLSPERLQMFGFQNELIETLDKLNLNYFIIDEAHCASEWGHDFRPSYLKLIDVVKKIDNPTIIAVTATASKRVKEDIINIFGLDNNNVIMSKSLDRPELSFEVINLDINQSKDEALKWVLFEDLKKVLRKESIKYINDNGSGIIFTVYANPTGRNTIPYGTEYIGRKVNELGIDSSLYHSKLNDDIREKTQSDFIENKFPILVSTKGFGMGIDKPNIDYIIHMCYSNSLEAYYQEAGRAGRDGEHAHSVIIARSRHPKCIENIKSLGIYEPECVDRWTCFYTGGMKCDYGMQARFIISQYPDPYSMKNDIIIFINGLKYYWECWGKAKKFKIKYNKLEAKKCQSYLFYLQKENVIKDFYILNYVYNGIEIGIEMLKDFEDVDIDGVAENITNKLQQFKKQKYNMLYSMWEYIDNDTMCRREFLMSYFGEHTDYGQEGCKFCDIEGISDEMAIKVTPDLRISRLYDKLNEILSSDSFSYESVHNLQIESFKENIQENIKIRSMRYLEDYPDNIAAMYLSSIISLKRDISDNYARNQIFLSVEFLKNKGCYEEAYDLLMEISEIDSILTNEIIYRLDIEVIDVDWLESILSNYHHNKQKELLYKYYLYNKVKKFSKSLY